MNYDWVLFDADGTLFDYDAAEGEALGRTLMTFGLPPGPRILEIYRQINGRLWREFEQGKTTAGRLKVARFALLFEALEADHDAGRRSLKRPDPARFGRSYLQHLGQCAHLIPDAELVLQALEDRVRLALITNGLSTVQRSRLAKSDLGRYFAAVVISDEEGVAKPDPRIFDVVFARMDQPSKEAVLMVGDSLTSDIQGAARYGIDACWFNPEARLPDSDVAFRYEIRQLRELLPIVDQTADPGGRA